MGKFNRDPIKLDDQNIMNMYKGSFTDLELSYSPLTSDNIQFSFEENVILHLKFVKINATVKGKYFSRFFFLPSIGSVDFVKDLYDLNWERLRSYPKWFRKWEK